MNPMQNLGLKAVRIAYAYIVMLSRSLRNSRILKALVEICLTELRLKSVTERWYSITKKEIGNAYTH